ncbi:hypothetical protein HYT51_01895 [Candidatus Woesearchaeota archaeon]|nr:hypothetical protein [Candidatus Woesearchaeota archaeon]
MMKKLITLIIMFLLVLVNAYALDKENGYAWLNKTLVENNWDFEVDVLSLGILALQDAHYDVSDGLDVLEGKKTGNSWDERIKESALAILALESSGRDTSMEKEWLKNAIIEARVSGDWLIQVNTDEGECTISYQDREKSITFTEGKAVECNNNYWIDVERCLTSQLSAYEEFLVDCNKVTGSPEISLLYREGDNYRIMPQQGSIRTTLTLESGCFGDKKDSTRCDFISSAFASWILTSLGENDVYTNAYLTSSIGDRVDHYALVYLTTLDDSYADWLIEKQALSGSWDSDVYRTGLSVLALRQSSSYKEEVDNAVEWLGTKQNSDGSFGSSQTALEDTAMVLYGVSGAPGGGNGIIQPPGSGYCGDLVVNEDEECDASYDNNGELLEGDVDDCLISEICVEPGRSEECICKAIEEIECSPVKKCDIGYECVRGKCELILEGCEGDDSKCGLGEICVANECVEEERCADGCDLGQECVDSECVDIPGYCFDVNDCIEGEEECVDNLCVEKGGFPIGIIIGIIVVFVIGIAGYFAYQKFAKKPKKSSDVDEFFTPRESPLKPIQQNREVRKMPSKKPYQDENIEKELDESLRKAKELLGKK